jgi:acetyl esterase/lipase
LIWKLDPEVGEALVPLMEHLGERQAPPLGDYAARRQLSQELTRDFLARLPVTRGVQVSTFACTASDAAEIPLRLYRLGEQADGALVVYLHGGGMIAGSIELYDNLFRHLVSSSGVALLAVGYRLAPEHRHPIPVEDCYAGLVWVAANAQTLGFDPARLAVAGESAGGGLAAAIALLARDRGGPAVARQLLFYPMLDDRNVTPASSGPDVLLWTYEDNATAWNALLGERLGADDVSHYAAPARATDLAGLPPAYIVVGNLDIFRDESVAFAARLLRAGVPVELHVHAGAPHGFDLVAFSSAVARRARADQIRVLQSI